MQVTSETHTQIIYVALKYTMSSWAHYALAPARGICLWSHK